MPETVHYTENSRPFRRELVPELIYDANPALVDFYYLAWKQAWEHIYETESLPFSPYIGEGCKRDRIWIWDSCLMGMFCRYAADVYPVCSTLDNLYALRDGRSGYPLSEFDGRDFIMPAQGFDKDIMRIFNRVGVKPHILPTAVDDPTVISMVEHGLGVSMMTELTLRGYLFS